MRITLWSTWWDIENKVKVLLRGTTTGRWMMWTSGKRRKEKCRFRKWEIMTSDFEWIFTDWNEKMFWEMLTMGDGEKERNHKFQWHFWKNSISELQFWTRNQAEGWERNDKHVKLKRFEFKKLIKNYSSFYWQGNAWIGLEKIQAVVGVVGDSFSSSRALT